MSSGAVAECVDGNLCRSEIRTGQRPKIVAVPVVCPPPSRPNSELSSCDSLDSPCTVAFPDDGWSDFDTTTVVKPVSASQLLAFELRLHSVVVSAAAQVQDSVCLETTTATRSTSASVPHDSIDHALPITQQDGNSEPMHAERSYEYGCWGANEHKIPSDVPRRTAREIRHAACAKIAIALQVRTDQILYSSDAKGHVHSNVPQFGTMPTAPPGQPPVPGIPPSQRLPRAFIALTSPSGAGCIRPPGCHRNLKVHFLPKTSTDQDRDPDRIMKEIYVLLPNMSHYSCLYGAQSAMESKTDAGGTYQGLITEPPQGQDDVRQPFSGFDIN